MDDDTRNEFFVGADTDDGIAIVALRAKLTRAQALNLAAWIVALADRDGDFARLLEKIQNT